MVFKYVVILSLSVLTAYGQSQKTILYDQYNQLGEAVVLPGEYISDLSTEKFDNRAHSVCATGIWLFYEHPNYNPNGNGGVEYTFGRSNYCVNLKTISGLVSSARFVGHPRDYSIDSFNIFEHTYFQGREEYAYNEINSLDILKGNHKSVIITGKSNWAVFDQPNFQGRRVCLSPVVSSNGGPLFIPDIQEKLIPHGSIKSVRKDC